MELLSVVIPTHNTCDLTLACLASLEAQDETAEIVVVDDASEDGTAAAVRSGFPHVEVVERERRGGFTVAANQGLERAHGDLLLLLNSDTEIGESGLASLVAAFEASPELGVGGAELIYPGGEPQWRGGGAPTLLWMFVLTSGLATFLRRYPFYAERSPIKRVVGPVAWVTGAAIALRRGVWEDVGPLDDRFRLYCQDLDLCLRAGEAGWRVEVVPGFVVEHRQGSTIDTLPGAGEGRRLDLLSIDLVLWADKHRGRNYARWARRALRAGCLARLAARTVQRPFLAAGRRAAFDRQTECIRAAVEALRGAGREGARP
jgi:N-acetylglucosaminyl-diphospho-decaprenol L-rhamnosyltransferase